MVKLLLLLLVYASFATVAVHAGEAHQRHVFFDFSASRRAHCHSSADVTAPSRLEIVAGKIPVEHGTYASPPNCLRLAWTSAFGGDWHARINAATRYGQRFAFAGDTLVMRCCSEEGLEPDAAPRLGVNSPGAWLHAIPLLKRHGPLPAGEWVQLEFPLASFAGQFRGTDDSKFDVAQLETVFFMQGLDDGRPHVLLVDDVRIVDRKSLDDKTPPPTPAGLTAEGGERHVDLAWQPVDDEDDDVVSYRIYRAAAGEFRRDPPTSSARSDDGGFVPIATRSASFTRAVDFVGEPGVSHAYRVTAVDVAGNESPLSEPVAATTRAMADDELLTMVQRACFRFYWEAAHPDAGLGLEILPGDEHLVALGGSGFGVMALMVGAERGFAPREAIAERMVRIVRFLKSADRFHGVWPHFLDGRTGKTIPFFGKYDNGGDLVETAFMVQGLLAARQYFDHDTPAEREIRETATQLWREVEWDWHRKTPAGPVLYWHWSPDAAWHISHPLVGWNESIIVYLLAIASPTHGVPAEMFHTGFAGTEPLHVEYRRNWSRTTDGDQYVNGKEYYGHKIDVGCGNGGELFFNQFSFLGFDPRGKRDKYANYFRNNRNIALASRAYAIDNPLGRAGYGPDCWGRSAGVNSGGGRALPRDDNGTICCSAALGVYPFTPDESLAALKHFYRKLGDKCWGAYGFHDGFNETEDWFDEVYMALNQAQITVMIENHRTGLVWEKFMANPEIAPMLTAVGFVPDEDDR
ncbi:MAG: hypothetical protein KF847_01185 [Pirellulales bacterium]|nr:hypothetical protein [Pirellulales bacterium]